jgi:2-octaprenyl-6-methoxyphenol hydroxylase
MKSLTAPYVNSAERRPMANNEVVTSAPIVEKDIVIAGSGFCALMLAHYLASHGFKIQLIERKSKDQFFFTNDARASALNIASIRQLERLGLWADLKPHAGPINHIYVAEEGTRFSALQIAFSNEMASLNPGESMGYIIPNALLLRHLYESSQHIDAISIIHDRSIKAYEPCDHYVRLNLDDETVIQAQLLVAADGRHSALRQLGQLTQVIHRYDQTAYVSTVHHTIAHQQSAYELFTKQGPLATLPLQDSHHVCLVWTIPDSWIETVKKLSVKEQQQLIQDRTGEWLGRIRLVDQPIYYPLSRMDCPTLITTRLALIGDAAHGMHPIAGQGLNLGLRDVAVLGELIIEAKENKQSIGSEALLTAYQSRRRNDINRMVGATHILNELFRKNYPGFSTLRSLGLGLCNNIPFFKRYAVGYATGLFN